MDIDNASHCTSTLIHLYKLYHFKLFHHHHGPILVQYSPISSTLHFCYPLHCIFGWRHLWMTLKKSGQVRDTLILVSEFFFGHEPLNGSDSCQVVVQKIGTRLVRRYTAGNKYSAAAHSKSFFWGGLGILYTLLRSSTHKLCNVRLWNQP